MTFASLFVTEDWHFRLTRRMWSKSSRPDGMLPNWNRSSVFATSSNDCYQTFHEFRRHLTINYEKTSRSTLTWTRKRSKRWRVSKRGWSFCLFWYYSTLINERHWLKLSSQMCIFAEKTLYSDQANWILALLANKRWTRWTRIRYDARWMSRRCKGGANSLSVRRRLTIYNRDWSTHIEVNIKPVGRIWKTATAPTFIRTRLWCR